MIIWGRRSSLNVQKVLWAAAEAGLDFERRTVGGSFGGTDTPEYRKMNPMGLVPVLQDGTVTMFESNAIVRYLARRYGAGTIRPAGMKALALAEQWTEWTNSTVMAPMGMVFMNSVRKPAGQADQALVAQGGKQLTGAMKIANRMLGRKPWLAGRKFSYGDIVFGVAYWRYRNLAVERPKTPQLERWYEQLSERPAFQQWVKVPIGANLEEWNRNEKELK